MIYHISLTDRAKKSLRKMNVKTKEMILDWLDEKIDGCGNPRLYGKALKGEFEGYWRYRVNDYRIIAEIHDNTVTVCVVDIGKRDSIYK